MKNIIILILSILVLVGGVCAIPTTSPSGGNTSNSVNLASVGAATPCWFEWGQQPGYLSWKTPNGTAASCLLTTIKGSPLNGGTVFYYRICDTTGCGSELSFVTTSVTPMPTTTFSTIFYNLTESGFDIQLLPWNAVQSYMWLLTPGFETIVWFMLFMAIYLGFWLGGRSLTIPSIVGLISGVFLWYGTSGLQLGLPAGIASVAQGIMYASIAGMIVGILKK